MKSQDQAELPLIQRFVQGPVEQATAGRLLVKPALGNAQILTRNGQLLAIAHLQHQPPEIQVSWDSDYVDLLDEVLESEAFVPVESSTLNGFICYCRR